VINFELSQMFLKHFSSIMWKFICHILIDYSMVYALMTSPTDKSDMHDNALAHMSRVAQAVLKDTGDVANVLMWREITLKNNAIVLPVSFVHLHHTELQNFLIAPRN